MRQARDVSKDSIHVRRIRVAGNIALLAKCMHSEYVHFMLVHGKDRMAFERIAGGWKLRVSSFGTSSQELRDRRVLWALRAP